MNTTVNEHRYDDIINLPHHQSATRPHMSNYDRAAQFAPFAALTGYDDAVKETARLTDRRIELDEGEKAAIDQRLLLVQERLPEPTEVTITYFVSDKRKAGGAYVSVRVMDNWVNILSGAAPEACNMRGACSPGYLVESDGGVFPCDFYALDEWHMGNIKTQSFFRLAKSEKALRFIESSRMIDANCTACPWYALCRGGCRRDREPFIDGRPGRNRLCEGYRRFFEARIDRLQSLAQWVSGKENSVFPC